MIIIRGIPTAVILCFVYLFVMELLKRFISNKEWHDKYIGYITMGIALLYGCVAAYFYGMNFYDSVQVVLGILASDNVFHVINKVAPNAVDRFELKPIDVVV